MDTPPFPLNTTFKYNSLHSATTQQVGKADHAPSSALPRTRSPARRDDFALGRLESETSPTFSQIGLSFFSESGKNPDYPPGDCHRADTKIEKWVYRAIPGFEIGNCNQQPDDRHNNGQAHSSRKFGDQPAGTYCGRRQRLLSGQHTGYKENGEYYKQYYQDFLNTRKQCSSFT